MQTELFKFPNTSNRLTIAEGFELLWDLDLRFKPSGKTFMPNRKAWCKSIGDRWLDEITEMDIKIHKYNRRHGEGPFQTKVGKSTAFNDHTLISLLFNSAYKWKRRGTTFMDLDCAKLQLPQEHPCKYLVKGSPGRRSRLVTPEEFAVLCEHVSEKMRKRAVFAMDTALDECDLRRLNVTQYNPYLHAIIINRKKIEHKNVKLNAIFLSKRCEEIVLEAKQKGWYHVLDWTNHVNEWRKFRLKFKITYQWRDIRKTNLNAIYEATGDLGAMRDQAGHTDASTTDTLYRVVQNPKLRDAVFSVEKKFPVPTNYF